MTQAIRRIIPAQSGMKRYNLVLPETLFNELEKLAIARQMSVAHLLRGFIKLGLMVAEEPDAVLVIRTEGGREREIVFLL